MLSKLIINNYALIDSLKIDFEGGFSVITGETGAGKSIILGALRQILGERVDTKSLRDGSKKSVVEAQFDLTGYDLEAVFKENDLEYYQGECILRREVMPNGRSRAFVNDSPVSLSQMRVLALHLVDIHSQHNNLLLADEQYQLSIVDNLADNAHERGEYAEAYAAYIAAKNDYDTLEKRISDSRADEDYMRFQLSQLDELNPKTGEEDELECELNTLNNATEIKNGLVSAMSRLEADDTTAILSELKTLGKELESLSKLVPEMEDLTNRVESCAVELKDVYDTIVGIDDRISDDPLRIEQLNERLELIYKLKKKHNVASEDELVVLRDELQRSIDEVDNSDFELEQKRKTLIQRTLELTDKAGLLTASRKKAAEYFQETVKQLAKPLGMTNICCAVEFGSIDFMQTGADKVVFLFSFNKNQQLLPLGNTASGGEISRLMLCVKTLIAHRMQLPTIIFDEIDTGVSGAVANKMGEMMRDISDRMQVIAITHLPQVAALGEQHYKVYKQDTADTTLTHIDRLDMEQRIAELAGMLGASSGDAAAVDNAKSLLKRYLN